MSSVSVSAVDFQFVFARPRAMVVPELVALDIFAIETEAVVVVEDFVVMAAVPVRVPKAAVVVGRG